MIKEQNEIVEMLENINTTTESLKNLLLELRSKFNFRGFEKSGFIPIIEINVYSKELKLKWSMYTMDITDAITFQLVKGYIVPKDFENNYLTP
jgi:hypothetical protein